MANLSTQGKIRLVIALAVLCLALGGSAFWYFAFHTKTPEYTLKQLQQAIVQHDEKAFHQYVDVERLMNVASDDLVAGMIDNSNALSTEAKNVIEGFAKIIKAPMISACKEILTYYVKTGEVMPHEQAASLPIDANQIIDRFGFRDFSFSEVAALEVDKESGVASVSLRLLQKATGEPFLLKLQMVKNDAGNWQINEVANLQEYITFVANARKHEVAAYLEESEAIQKRHDKSSMAIEEKMAGMLKLGIMGNASLRQDLAKLIQDGLMADWKQRREELSAVRVPPAAQVLHHLRLHICDARITYSENYIQWLKEQKPVSLRKANEKLREIRTMEHEAVLLKQQLEKK